VQSVGFEIETLQVLQFARTHSREGKHNELGAARFCSCAEDQVDLLQGRSALWLVQPVIFQRTVGEQFSLLAPFDKLLHDHRFMVHGEFGVDLAAIGSVLVEQQNGNLHELVGTSRFTEFAKRVEFVPVAHNRLARSSAGLLLLAFFGVGRFPASCPLSGIGFFALALTAGRLFSGRPVTARSLRVTIAWPIPCFTWTA